MKRNPRLEEILPFWHLFAWRRCCSCGKEFRREKGWFKPNYISIERIKYLCSDCAPDRLTALAFFDKQSF